MPRKTVFIAALGGLALIGAAVVATSERWTGEKEARVPVLPEAASATDDLPPAGCSSCDARHQRLKKKKKPAVE